MNKTATTNPIIKSVQIYLENKENYTNEERLIIRREFRKELRADGLIILSLLFPLLKYV